MEGLHRGTHGGIGWLDFFSAEVLTWRGPATYYVLFVIRLETRRVTLAGMTRHPCV
jgi:hypothetical protein